MLQKLTYLAIRHHPQIKCVDTVREYTFGVIYFVEVEIELPDDLPLKEAHAFENHSRSRSRNSLKSSERLFISISSVTTNRITQSSASCPAASLDRKGSHVVVGYLDCCAGYATAHVSSAVGQKLKA